MNQAINFFWTILCFIPVVGFWAVAGISWLLYVFVGVCVLSLLVRASALQLSTDPKYYERLGVKLIRKLVQNGDISNKISRRRNAGHKFIKNRSGVASYHSTVVMYERYHFACFIFFLITGIYAVSIQETGYCVIIFLANIIYNICPILLQQYNRARILKVSKRYLQTV